MPSASTLRARIESSLGERLCSAQLLRERAAPLTISTGVAAIDALIGGLPRGALSEIAGQASSGRTGVMLAALAGATRRQEVCALVDASDSFDPASAAVAGVDLERLLWVRCSDMPGRKPGAMRATLGRLEQVLRVTDLLLQSGGFGMVTLDLGDIPPESTRRIPLTSWFRFRRAVEPTATVLLLVEQEPCAKTCASLVVRLQREAVCVRDSVPTYAQQESAQMSHYPASFGPDLFREIKGGKSLKAGEDRLSAVPENNVVSHAALLRGMQLRAEVVRSWRQCKPARLAGVSFEALATW
jgi:recA bacterial DNA recombination protein